MNPADLRFSILDSLWARQELALAGMWLAAFGLNSYRAKLVRHKRLEVKKAICSQVGKPWKDTSNLCWPS